MKEAATGLPRPVWEAKELKFQLPMKVWAVTRRCWLKSGDCLYAQKTYLRSQSQIRPDTPDDKPLLNDRLTGERGFQHLGWVGTKR